MGVLSPYGEAVKDFVLWISGSLKADAAPGFAVISLVVLLIFLMALLWSATRRFCRAILEACTIIESHGAGSLSGEDVTMVSRDFGKWLASGKANHHKLAVAWKEFEETLVRFPTEDGRTPIKNAVRPSNFFNLADMGVSTSFWRAWPGVFVTVGLLLTFLGLIAALNEIGGDLSDEALSTLLTVASAKFIMSLTGLFCSIVFGFFLRARMGRMDKALHQLCDAIEQRLNFVSLEEIAKDQLAEVRKQSEQTQALITQLIANIDEPLKTGLPNAIRLGIAEAMIPVVEKIGTAGSDGVASTMENLSGQLTDGIGGALTQVSDRLATAGETLEALAGRMDNSSSRMGGEMEAAITRLAASVDEMREGAGAAAQQTSARLTESAETLFAGMRDALERIQSNTAENGAAMERAARAMTEAASTFKAEIGAASQEGREIARSALQGAGEDAAAQVNAAGLAATASIGTSLAAVTERAEALGSKVSTDLFGPLDAMREALERASENAARGATEMARFSAGAEAGAVSAREAAGLMGETAQTLTAAATPIRETAGRFEAAAREAASATNASVETLKTGADSLVQSAQSALEAGRTALAAERDAIAANLAAVETALEKFEGIAGRFDTIDDKLGDALAQYRQEIESALANIGERSKTIYDDHARALDALTTLVSQAEAFSPAQGG